MNYSIQKTMTIEPDAKTWYATSAQRMTAFVVVSVAVHGLGILLPAGGDSNAWNKGPVPLFSVALIAGKTQEITKPSAYTTPTRTAERKEATTRSNRMASNAGASQSAAHGRTPRGADKDAPGVASRHTAPPRSKHSMPNGSTSDDDNTKPREENNATVAVGTLKDAPPAAHKEVDTEKNVKAQTEKMSTRTEATHQANATMSSTTSVDADASGSTNNRTLLVGKIAEQLQALVAKHLNYPLLARRRGWEGDVLLGLRIDKNGRFQEIKVLRSSGYGLLDQAAVRALSRTAEELPSLLLSFYDPLTLELPVTYRLYD